MNERMNDRMKAGRKEGGKKDMSEGRKKEMNE